MTNGEMNNTQENWENFLTPSPPDCYAQANLVLGYVNVFTKIVCLCGIGANAVNLLVFYRQGFRESVQISLTGLAISDLLTDVTMAIYCWTILDKELCLSLNLPTELWFSSSWLVYGLSLNSSCLAVFISVERCLCTAVPFKVKDILTPRRSHVIIFGIAIISLAFVSPSLSLLIPAVISGKTRNSTQVDLSFPDQTPFEISFSLAAVSNFQSVALVCLLVATLVLITSLSQNAKRRGKMLALQSETGRSLHRRDQGVNVMMVTVCLVILVCFTPGQILTVIRMIDSEFSHGRRRGFHYRVCWALSYFLYAVNSSVNILIYYKMSSKYRRTLEQIQWSPLKMTSDKVACRQSTSRGTELDCHGSVGCKCKDYLKGA